MKDAFNFVPFKLTKVEMAEPKVPYQRSGHKIVCDDSNVFCYGGYSENVFVPLIHLTKYLFQEIWCYNISKKTWKKLGCKKDEVPKEVASSSVDLVGDYMFIFGGTSLPFGQDLSNTMNVCNLKTLTWQRFQTTAPRTRRTPTGRYGHATYLHKDTMKIYYIGGTNGYDFQMDILEFDLRKQTWKVLFESHETASRGKFPDPRLVPKQYKHEVGFYMNKIFILGGGTTDKCFSLSQIWTFNLKSLVWNCLDVNPDEDASIVCPSPRSCHSSVQVDEDIFISGGIDSSTVPIGYSDIWKLHLPTLKWTQLSAKLPCPLYFHSATITPSGCMYIYGGVQQVGSMDSRRIVRSKDMLKMWMKIPNLVEICWEAMCQSMPQLIDPDILTELGVPAEFVNRAMHLPPSGPGQIHSSYYT